MVYKLVIGNKGKAWKVELDSEVLAGKSLGDKVDGKDLKAELEGYEIEITGGTDTAGFPLKSDVEGIGLRRVLLTKGWGMRDSRKGVRIRKTVRGKTISEKVTQINLKVVKEGKKKLSDIFPEQNTAEQSSAVPLADGTTKGKVAEPEKVKEVKVEEKVEAN